ncbi:porin [Hymenobacter jejuensis]|nr:porin [Hymenobacter jejuensis]
MRNYLMLSLLLLAASHAFAQVTPATDSTLAVPPTAAPEATPPNPLSFYGYVDGYYGYDFKHADTQKRPGFLYSHNRQNEFTINNGIVGLRYQDEKVRGAFGLHAGSYVEANYAAEPQVFKHIYEAYAGFRPFEKAWLDVGIFGSHIGFESAISKDNWTLTRSLAAENSPYYETGARFTYEVDPKLTLTGLVLNGWQNIQETNQSKAVGTQIQWKPTEKLLFNSSTFYGNEQPQGVARRRRYFHDFYASYAATDRLSVVGVFDVGKQARANRSKTDTWHTGAALLRYKLAEKWAVAGRAEYYYAEHGVIISSITPADSDEDFKVKSFSLNLDYLPVSKVACRVEGRIFHSPKNFLLDRNGQPTDNYGNVTSSIAISF